MYEEFFNYIAKRIVAYFDQQCDNLHAGDRFYFRLDNGDLVQDVYEALRSNTAKNGRQGLFQYKDVYKTFTIKLDTKEVIIAAKTGTMTDDFFGTLRNIPFTENANPLLMITSSPNDTVRSAAQDLSAKGMPFCADELIKTIEENIEEAQMSPSDHILLLHELNRKKADRFADRESLFEYRSLLTSLCSGVVSTESWIDFRLLPDSDKKYCY